MAINMIEERDNAVPQTDRPQLGRTFAMTVVSAGHAVVLAGLAYFMIAVVLPIADEPPAAVIIPVFSLFIAVFGVIGTLSVIWTGARRRAWFWLVAAVPALLLELLNARRVPYDFSHPANTSSFLVTIVVIPAALAIVVGGVAAFLEIRRGRATWTRSGRAGWVITAIIGALVGAAITSVLAGSTTVAGGVAEAPTVTGTLTVENSMFVETSLEMKNGEVLGLFVINKDGIGHAFDVDSLGIHVQLPANSTTVVAIKPTGPGNLEFYCDVPGHKSAGMVGTIAVES